MKSTSSAARNSLSSTRADVPTSFPLEAFFLREGCRRVPPRFLPLPRFRRLDPLPGWYSSSGSSSISSSLSECDGRRGERGAGGAGLSDEEPVRTGADGPTVDGPAWSITSNSSVPPTNSGTDGVRRGGMRSTTYA
jgi:hypothetical protein